MSNDMEIIESFLASRTGGAPLRITAYHVPVDDGSGSYMLMVGGDEDIVISETYMDPLFPQESTKAKFDRKVREYLKQNELSRI